MVCLFNVSVSCDFLGLLDGSLHAAPTLRGKSRKCDGVRVVGRKYSSIHLVTEQVQFFIC